jgi:hypothetical protein
MAMSTNMAVFWVFCTASIIRVMIALMMEAVQPSETLVHLYHSTWHHNPEDNHPKGFPTFSK